MADDQLGSITETLLGIDGEEAEEARRWGGSVPGKSLNVNCNREEAAHRLHLDYFSEFPVYSSDHFPDVLASLLRYSTELLNVLKHTIHTSRSERTLQVEKA